MICSMTGFGRGQYKTGEVEVSVEIRSVNHRYSDISIRMPRYLSFLEEKVREYIQHRIYRGRVDLFITYEILEQKMLEVRVDSQLARNYMSALSSLRESMGLKDDITLSFLASLPDVINKRQGELDEEEVWNQICPALEQAVEVLVEMRRREGENLKMDVMTRLETIGRLVSEIEGRSRNVILEYRDKLEKRVGELSRGIELDSDRLYQEVVIFADRSNIAEEIVRLRSHISQTHNTLNGVGAVGRKLDFLVQEMNREINTIASKANDKDISSRVVDIKSEIEKIREQVQNIE